MSVVIQHWARFRFLLPEAGCILALGPLPACVRVCSRAACMQGAEQDVKQPLSPSAGCSRHSLSLTSKHLGCFCLCPTMVGWEPHTVTANILSGCWGFELRSPCLRSKCFLSTELSSQPWCLSSWPMGYGARMELCNWMQGSQKTINSKDRLLCVLWPEVKSNSNANEYRCLAALTVEHAATAATVLNTEQVHFALCMLLYCADWWTLLEIPRLGLNWCITNCSGHMKFCILIEALLLNTQNEDFWYFPTIIPRM